MDLKYRMAALILLDSCIVIFSIFIGYAILYPGENLSEMILIVSSFILLVSHHVTAVHYGLYRRVWAYASTPELTAIAKAVTISVVFVAVFQAAVFSNVLVRALVITWMMHVLFIGGSRFVWRLYRERIFAAQNENEKLRLLIIGAGSAGTSIVHQIQHSNSTTLKPVVFLDDDPFKIGLQIYNVPVVGNNDQLEDVVRRYRIDQIIIAIPSMKKSELAELTNRCIATGVKTQTTPSLEDLWSGELSISQIRDVRIEDLLGREEIKLDLSSISKNITGKVVMVTGAGGSIGSELCRQLIRFTPKKLLLLGHGENSIYHIYQELSKYEVVKNKQVKLIQIIADVKDKHRIIRVMETHLPDVVYHAAAHKHVPLMEYNPHEAVKNNIIGTKNVAESAHHVGVKTLVFVSTDKAVNPTNVMGASKRIAEMVVQSMNGKSNTRFVAVRFGNVLGSRGSVIPLFKKQIEAGGPVTVTDERMTRYFMTIPEASRLVIQAGSLAKGGEVFVLDMGEPVKIVDLARNLIYLSGFKNGEIDIQFTGIRPGEKMYEELLDDDEILPGEVYEKIYVGRVKEVDEKYIEHIIDNFIGMNNKELKDMLMELVYRERKELAAQGS